MSKVLMLARREYLAAVRTKSFIVMLVVMPIFMGGGGIGMALMENRGDTTDLTLAVVDHSGLLAPILIEAAEQRNATDIFDEEKQKKTRPAYRIEVVEPTTDATAQSLNLSDRVRSKELQAYLIIGPDVLHPGEDSTRSLIAYHAEAAILDDMRRWIQNPLNSSLRRLRAIEAGVPETELDDLFQWINVDGLGLVSKDMVTGEITEAERSSKGRAVFVPLVLVMLMLMMFMMSALPQLTTVMEEKQQRIAEVMLGSLKPFQFMMGKVLGGVGVSLTCITVYIVGGAITLKKLGLESYIPYDILPWFFAFLVLAIVMFGAMFAALGSACNDNKEAQSLTFPAMVPMILPFFVLGPILEQPMSGVATVISLIPTCTPMAMILRMASPVSIPAWQPWVGLALVVATTILSVWAGGRIFRVAILMQGTPPKAANLVKWMIRG